MERDDGDAAAGAPRPRAGAVRVALADLADTATVAGLVAGPTVLVSRSLYEPEAGLANLGGFLLGLLVGLGVAAGVLVGVTVATCRSPGEHLLGVDRGHGRGLAVVHGVLRTAGTLALAWCLSWVVGRATFDAAVLPVVGWGLAAVAVVLVLWVPTSDGRSPLDRLLGARPVVGRGRAGTTAPRAATAPAGAVGAVLVAAVAGAVLAQPAADTSTWDLRTPVTDALTTGVAPLDTPVVCGQGCRPTDRVVWVLRDTSHGAAVALVERAVAGVAAEHDRPVLRREVETAAGSATLVVLGPHPAPVARGFDDEDDFGELTVAAVLSHEPGRLAYDPRRRQPLPAGSVAVYELVGLDEGVLEFIVREEVTCATC